MMTKGLKKYLAGTVLAGVMMVGAAMPAAAQFAADAPAGAEATAAPIDTKVLELQPTDRVLGKTDAPVTIVEYASLSCTHCAHFHNDVLPQIKTDFIDTGKAKLVMRNFPLNEPALKGAMLVNCLEPDQYYTFLKVLFQMQDKWAFSNEFKDNLQQIASVGGVAPEKFRKCLADTTLEKQALFTRKEAEDGLQIRATPTAFINGTRLEGALPYEDYAKVINAALSKAGQAAPAQPAAQ